MTELFCPECNNDNPGCDDPLHQVFNTDEVWEHALMDGILHGHELEDLDPYK